MNNDPVNHERDKATEFDFRLKRVTVYPRQQLTGGSIIKKADWETSDFFESPRRTPETLAASQRAAQFAYRFQLRRPT